MSYVENVPDANQSPYYLPQQNSENFTRLKKIITADHVFNDTSADDDGIHRQVTIVNRPAPGDPTSVPAGASSMMYGKTATDSVNELWFFDAVSPRQLNWRELTGTVALSGTVATVVAVPANSYGQIFMYFDHPAPNDNRSTVQFGWYSSTATEASAYSSSIMYGATNLNNVIVRFASWASPQVSGLNIRATINTETSLYSGTWNYIIYYRLK